MGWLYGVPAANRSLMSGRSYMYAPQRSFYGLDWYTPSDQVSAQIKCSTVKGLYKYRLLMLAHDSFYNFLSVLIMKLFTKYECNYNLQL